MKKLNKKGFTLIEMLVVIAIIAILVAIIVPTVSKSTFKSKCAVDAANLRSLTAEAAIDYLDNNKIDKEYRMDVKSTGATNAEITFNVTTAADGSQTINGDELIGTVAGKTVEDFAYGAEHGEWKAASSGSGSN